MINMKSYPVSALTWDLVAVMSGAKKTKLRSKRTIRRRAIVGIWPQEGSSNAIVDEVLEQDSDTEVLEEEGDVDVNNDYEDTSKEDLDNNVHYWDDNKDK